MADNDGIDLYADVDDFGQTVAQDHGADNNVSDLYDAMVTTSTPVGNSDEAKHESSFTKVQLSDERHFLLYVGNLTWWTSEQDLNDLIASSGVTDLIEIKFHENRNNGQSKGFATVIVGSEESLNMLLTKLPKKELYGKQILATLCTKQNLKLFDVTVPARNPVTNGEQQHHSSNSSSNSGSVQPPDVSSPHQRQTVVHSSPHGGYPPVGQRWAPHPAGSQTPSSAPPIPAGHGMVMLQHSQPNHGPPPPRMHLVPPGMVVQPGGPTLYMRGPQNIMIGHHDLRAIPLRSDWNGPPGQHMFQRQRLPPPGANAMGVGGPGGYSPSGHQQPYPPSSAPPYLISSSYQSRSMGSNARVSDRYGRSNYARSSYQRSSPYERREQSSAKMSENEFDEILQKNKSISSGAITRAIQDATAGDYPSSIETLVTAISLIRQSKICDDERCNLLISSLQDTLQGIEQKSYETKVSVNRSRSRDRSWSHDDDDDTDRRQRSRSRRRSVSRGSADRDCRETSRDRGDGEHRSESSKIRIDTERIENPTNPID